MILFLQTQRHIDVVALLSIMNRLPELSNWAQSAQAVSYCRPSRFSAWLISRISDVLIELKYKKVVFRKVINGSNHKTSLSKGFSERSRAITFFSWLLANTRWKSRWKYLHIKLRKGGVKLYLLCDESCFSGTAILINKLSLRKPFSKCWTAKIFTTNLVSSKTCWTHFSKKELQHWDTAEMKRLSSVR